MAGTRLTLEAPPIYHLVDLALGEHKEGAPWRGTNGRLYHPGEILEDGNIVASKPGCFYSAGTIWIDRVMLPAAEVAGWRNNRLAAGNMVQVER